MATFYTDSNQRVGAPMMYLREPSSYPETSLVPSSSMMLYMNSSASFCSDTTTTTTTTLANSQQPPPSSCIDTVGGGGGMESNFSGRDPTHEMLQVMNHHHHPSTIHLQHSGHGQGLSLSLGTQIPGGGGGFHMPSSPTSHSNMGLLSFLSPNPEDTTRNNLNNPNNENSRNIMEYIQAAGFNQDSSSSSLLMQQQQGAAVRNIPNSRYLKAAQQLLEEVVNVKKALKQADDHQTKEHNNEGPAKSSEDGDGGGPNSSPKESAASKELSHSEKQELQNKLTKLLTMLDEIDKRYKQYYHQMQFVVSSFDAVAGPGAAKPYTALALQRISRHFRCLRDAITGQIQGVRKSLGEQDSNSGVGIARLRYVDQQLRQQRALQQLGMMQPHAWRPQRGLPETSVSILRAWLFEHFLHPYPKDSDKIMLARQTGLTRSQVSNWFINARVRLWKPMVEEMYKEETGDAEMDSNSSSENALKALNKADIGSSEDRGEDMMMQKTLSSFDKFTDPRSNHHNHIQQQQDIEMVGSSGGAAVASFMTGARNIETEYNVKLRGEQQSVYESSNNNNNRFMSDAETAFHMSELGRFGNGTGVSLTLGLQHFEGGGGGMSFSGGGAPMHHHHHGFVQIRGDDEFYSSVGGGSSVGTAEYNVVNNNENGGGTQQQQHPGQQQLLHDFVA